MSGTAGTHSIYHALQATLNRRFRDGLLLKGAYTWSKAIDEAPYSDWTEYRYNAAIVFDRNRALADHDIPHNFQLAAVYELPFGKEKKWATEGLSSAIFGGWQLNGVFAAYSGRPFNSDCVRLVAEHAGQPADARPDQATTSRSSGMWAATARTSIRRRSRASPRSGSAMWVATPCAGLASSNLDLGLFRSFKIRTSELQFRLEAFNATNTPHFANPNGNVNSANFGRVLATQSADAMGRSRQFRVGVRMTF